MKASTPLAALFLALSLPGHAALVGHWALDEGAGTTAADSSGSGNTGTIAGGATWTTADLPPVPTGTTSAIVLDGTDDQINIVGFKGIPGTGARTIAAWIKTGINSPQQNKAIVSWGTNATSQKWTFRIQTQNGTPGAIRIEANGGFFVGNTVVTDAQWHHVAVTWEDDGTPNIQDAKLYVDGVLDAEFGNFDTPPSDSQSIAINTATGADVRIGDDFQTTHNWNGSMDDVRIYDEALDAAAIAVLANDTPIITSFEADAEIVASGAPVVLSWESDPANDTLVLDNGIGDVSGLTMTTVNPTADTTYTLTGTRGGDTNERSVTVLVGKAPLIDQFINTGSDTILEGGSTTVRWDTFGEASLDLNGTDVTGETSADLSPTENTTYTLSATNPFGTTTAELTITVLDGSFPDLSWTAAGLNDGDLAQWDPAINATGNNGITFVNNTGGTVQSGATNFSGVSSWVNSPGYNLMSNPADSWQDGLGDLATKADVSWEMVFRPGDFTGTHTLFNTGGNGDGTAIVLTDSILDFRFQTANNNDQRLIISADLSTIGAATDFFHIVASADVGAAVPGTATLYVNGQLVSGPTSSVGFIDDWDGGDLAELGKGNNIPAGNPFNPDAFTGDIALFNYYGNRLLNASQVTAAYDAIAGAPADLIITNIDYNAALSQIAITFNSTPGANYAIDYSDDMTFDSWLELNDSIPATGAETTTIVSGVPRPNPDAPNRFYRIRPGE